MNTLLVSLLMVNMLKIKMPRPKEYLPRAESHLVELADSYAVGIEVANAGVEQGWKLEIPSIELNERMDEVFIQDRTIPVPDNSPGVLTTSSGLFIVGHTPGVFSRLREFPSEITVVQNGVSRKYSLYSYEESRVENISMNKLLNHGGVVLMTCSGERIGDKMSHRLILYYR